MTAAELKNTSKEIKSSNEEELQIPLDITDIINICQEFNKLGQSIQFQLENILECGVEESIKSKIVSKEALPHIKNFLQQIVNVNYFGDAVYQSKECIYIIDEFLSKNKNSLMN